MTPRTLIFLKRLCLCLIIISSALLSIYLIFLFLVSAWVGITYHYAPGSWVPITAGLLFASAVMWAHIRFTRYLMSKIRTMSTLDI